MELRDQLQHTLGSSYTLERELGGGGMSRVFVAQETRLGRKVVVKVLSPELAADISAERFEREIKLAASLQQANIVPVLTTGEAGGVPYYTMPYAEGESLRALLATRGALPISETVGILRDVAHALSYAHARGIVHRDIKPDNVLLSHGTAVVTDFGIAKAISAARTGTGNPTLTQAGVPIGTPAYMAPEQVAGDPSIDHRADIYAFGCLAYELLTGHPPFVGQTVQHVLGAHIAEVPEPVRELRPDTPAVLASLVMRCLEKRPGSRPASADEMTRALESVATPQAMDNSGAPKSRWRLTVNVLGLTAIVVVAVVLWRARIGQTGVTANKSLTVLPLKNLYIDKSNEGFGEGLAEDIAHALQKAGVTVIGTGSARELAEKGLGGAAIATQLGVGYLLRGSIQQAGDSIRISMSLSSGQDGKDVWGNNYNKQLKDVFAVQDSIAYQVAKELQTALASGPRAPLADRGTRDLEAYELYVEGMQLWEKRTPAAFDSAIARFKLAIQRDSRYARAHAGLALSYASLPDYQIVDARKSAEQATNEARQALRLDRTLADAWAAIALSQSKLWHNASADSAYQRAISLDPYSARAHHWYALLLRRVGNVGEARREIELARENDPTLIITSNDGAIRLTSGDVAGAEDVLRRSLALDPNYPETHIKLGLVLLVRGLGAEATTEIQRGIALGGGYGSARNTAFVALAYALSGRQKQAGVLLNELTSKPGTAHIGPVALVYSALGDHKHAIEWLQRSVDEFDSFLSNWSHLPFFEPLRADPLGKAALARVESTGNQ
jgi:serine/threonine-protein kinase